MLTGISTYSMTILTGCESLSNPNEYAQRLPRKQIMGICAEQMVEFFRQRRSESCPCSIAFGVTSLPIVCFPQSLVFDTGGLRGFILESGLGVEES